MYRDVINSRSTEKRNRQNEMFAQAGIYFSVDVYIRHRKKKYIHLPSTKETGMRLRFNRTKHVKQKMFHLMRNENNGPHLTMPKI